MSLPKSLLLKHNFMYTKRGGVAAYHVVCIGLCLRSVPGVRVLANAVDGSSGSYNVLAKVTIIKTQLYVH